MPNNLSITNNTHQSMSKLQRRVLLNAM